MITARGHGEGAVRDISKQPLPENAPPVDAVEVALATAIGDASTARRWDVVAQLAKELEAEREEPGMRWLRSSAREGVYGYARSLT